MIETNLNLSVDQEIEPLFKDRFHGSVNIRGIRYQLLYSVLRAFDLYKNKTYDSLQLEGIEDVDLLGLEIGNEYIQVKTSEKSWNWAKLKEIISKFIEVLRSNPNSKFRLVINSPLKKDIARLSNCSTLKPEEKNKIKLKFRNLCKQIGASLVEADSLIEKVKIEYLQDEKLILYIKKSFSNIYGVGSEAVIIYFSAFIKNFLDWAVDRKQITKIDLDTIRTSIGEALAKEQNFQAYGRGLIEKNPWEIAGNQEGFLEGKGASPCHIIANSDVKRPIWDGKIEKVFSSSKICIIKSSSGQGKSTLSFRYAYDHWPHETTFLLKVAETQEHVELVCDYLHHWSNLGVQIFLVIDDIGLRVRMWPLVAQKCIEYGIQILVTVRSEDWFRYGGEGLANSEIIVPTLEFSEAKYIYETYESEGFIHKSVVSAEWAWEYVGKPHLLIEYVYLITHGSLLKDRLKEQIRQFRDLKEDPAKIEILRRTAFAHSLGVPVIAEKMLRTIKLKEDLQQVLLSLSGEYLSLEEGSISGLHWVRSQHLSNILHEEFPNLSVTALATLDAVPHDDLSVYITNAFCKRELDTEAFFGGLVENAKGADIATLLQYLNGIYEAGEKFLFQANKALFDEIYKQLGPSGVMLFSWYFMPVVKLGSPDDLFASLGESHPNFLKLRKLKDRFQNVERGMDLCKRFLRKLTLNINTKLALKSYRDAGVFFDWLGLCNVKLNNWDKAKDSLCDNKKIFALPITDYCSFTQGLYRYDNTAFMNWYNDNKNEISAYLQFHLDLVEFKQLDTELSIEFLVDVKSEEHLNEQAVSRLNLLRSAIPFCEAYRSEGIYLMPFNLKPSVDETIKNIPQENLPFSTDVDKNVVWRLAGEKTYLPDSYYVFQREWYTLRSNQLKFIKGLNRGFKKILCSKAFDFNKEFNGRDIMAEINRAFTYLPDLPFHTSKDLVDLFKEGVTPLVRSFNNFVNQFFQYLKDRSDAQVAGLILGNYNDALKHLPEMQDAFKSLFKHIPDYFNAQKLDSREIKEFTAFKELLDFWIEGIPQKPPNDVLQLLKARKAKKRQTTINSLKTSLKSIDNSGRSLIYPSDTFIDYPLRYLPIAYSVDDPINYQDPLIDIAQCLSEVSEISDYYCLIPVHSGKRFLQDGLQLSTATISNIANDNLPEWERISPIKFKEGILDLLPQIPFEISNRLEVFGGLLQLIGYIDTFSELNEKMNRYFAIVNNFKRKDQESSNIKIQVIASELLAVISKLKVLIHEEFKINTEDKYYLEVNSFLSRMETELQKEMFLNAISKAEFNTQKIEYSIQQLMYM